MGDHMKRILVICIGMIYAPALMAGCGPSKDDADEKPDIRIEATLYEQNGDGAPKQLSYDFDEYHPDDKNGYVRDNTKHTFSAYSPSQIKLGDATTIQGQSANIVYYVYLNDALFRDATENAQIKINDAAKKFYVDRQGHYALLCAKTVEPDKK